MSSTTPTSASLDPFVADYGASLFNGGDYLNFSFDTSLTSRGGGVIFGTTSLSDGAFGSIVVGVPEPASVWLVMLALGLLLQARRSEHDRRQTAEHKFLG